MFLINGSRTRKKLWNGDYGGNADENLHRVSTSGGGHIAVLEPGGDIKHIPTGLSQVH
jgi:hypothetical protein